MCLYTHTNENDECAVRRFWYIHLPSIRPHFPLADEGQNLLLADAHLLWHLFIKSYGLSSQQQERQPFPWSPLPKILHMLSVASSWDLFQSVMHVWLDLEPASRWTLTKSMPLKLGWAPAHQLPVMLTYIEDRPNCPGCCKESSELPHLHIWASPHFFSKWGSERHQQLWAASLLPLPLLSFNELCRPSVLP